MGLRIWHTNTKQAASMSLLAAGFIIGVENGVEWGGASLGGGGGSI